MDGGVSQSWMYVGYRVVRLCQEFVLIERMRHSEKNYKNEQNT